MSSQQVTPSSSAEVPATQTEQQCFLNNLENSLVDWVDETFSTMTIEKLEQWGYMGFLHRIALKLKEVGSDRVFDRPSVDWLWIRTVGKLWHKRESENGRDVHDPSEFNVLLLQVSNHILFLVSLC